jgi:hypothetical protein
MRARIVSAVFDLTTDPRDKGRSSFTIVGEIECAAGSILPSDRLATSGGEDDFQLQYLTWKGTVLKRTIPFLCVGDN